MPQSFSTLTPASGSLLVLLLALAWAYFRMRRRFRQFKDEVAAERAQAEESDHEQADETRLVRLLVDLTRLTERLQDARDTREIPQVVVDLAQGTFQADRVVVLFVRHDKERPTQGTHLVVGATSAGAVERARDELIPIGEGEIGWVAQEQCAVDRSDLDELGSARHATVPGLGRFRTELAAPMVVGGETLGVVALAGVGRHFRSEKAILTLVAQIAGFGLRSAASHHELRSEAELDGLTLTLNRRATTRRLRDLFAEAEAKEKGLGLLMLDVDRFKEYNDSNGHAAGDRILQELTRVVSRSIRAEDVFGRVGGEEFLVVSPDQTVASAYGLAEKLRRTVEEHRFRHEDGSTLGQVTISGGIAVFPGHAANAAELFERADEALYRAKAAGRNRVEISAAELA